MDPRFKRHSKWSSQKQQLEYMDWLAKKFNIKSMEDWYKIRTEDIANNRGMSMLRLYKNSPSTLITSSFPNYSWKIWKFTQVPHHFWDSKENQLEYMEWLAKELNVNSMEDWYKVTQRLITKHYGAHLLRLYNNSTSALITSLFPNYPWKLWKFTHVPNNFWNRKENQLEYMNWLAKELKLTSMEDWYHVSVQEFKDNYGYGLLGWKYGCTPSALITSVYSNYPWKLWKFATVPKSVWRNKRNIIDFFAEISNTESTSQYAKNSLINSYTSLRNVLRYVNPNTQWNFLQTITKISLGQQHLFQLVKQICRENNISENLIKQNYKHPTLKHSKSNKNIELDIFVERVQLAFEYQGGHHYIETSFNRRNPFARQLERDKEKKNLCFDNGITLIVIPERWSGLLEDLKATIEYYCPNVFPSLKNITGTIIEPPIVNRMQLQQPLEVNH